VAEERTRIARELHDIVAHAVSVMVLQVGAVRHRLPATLAEDREALQGVEQAGRAAADQLRIEVSDNGHGAAASDGRGHGLIGIHERVKLYGGEMSTASAHDGGFTLTARLPLTEYRS